MKGKRYTIEYPKPCPVTKSWVEIERWCMEQMCELLIIPAEYLKEPQRHVSLLKEDKRLLHRMLGIEP